MVAHADAVALAAEETARHLGRVEGVAGKATLMRRRCPKCGEERELVANPRRVVLHALPELRSPLEIVEPFACPTCGQEVSHTIRFASTDRSVELSGSPQHQPAPEGRNGHVWED